MAVGESTLKGAEVKCQVVLEERKMKNVPVRSIVARSAAMLVAIRIRKENAQFKVLRWEDA
jgi:hypothetical protein